MPFSLEERFLKAHLRRGGHAEPANEYYCLDLLRVDFQQHERSALGGEEHLIRASGIDIIIPEIKWAKSARRARAQVRPSSPLISLSRRAIGLSRPGKGPN